MRTGLHSFDDLNGDTLSSLAGDYFDRAARQTIRTTAKLNGLGGSKTLDPKTAGALVGLGDRQVRKVVQRVTKWINDRL